MRVGIFGGSFDPIHIGHLWIASAAVESLSLDQLRFLPAAQNPLKTNAPVATDDQRLRMLHLATGGNPHFQIDDREIRRGEVSYTVKTLRELSQERPKAAVFLIIGGDSLAEFGRWNEPEEILKLASLACVRRGGQGELDYRSLEPLADRQMVEQIESNEITMPVIEIASRQLRDRVAQKRSIRYFVPAAVNQMIDCEGIYS